MVEVTVAVPAKGDLTFNFTDKLITADNLIDELTAQELANAARDAEDELIAMSFGCIVQMGGKTDIGGSVSTGIVIELLGWSIVSAKTSGTFIVKDGTVIKTGLGGDIFSSNPNVTQINLMTQAGIISETGVSGLTASESAQLSNSLTKKQFLALN